MPLPFTGPIKLKTVNVEIEQGPTQKLQLGSQLIRKLAGKPSGKISMSDLYGKSFIQWNTETGVLTGSGSIQIPVGVTSVLIRANGAQGSTGTSPGQPYIAPSTTANPHGRAYKNTGDPGATCSDTPGSTGPTSVRIYAQDPNYPNDLFISWNCPVTNPGQPYVAPSTYNTTGASTTVTLNGKTETFVGTTGPVLPVIRETSMPSNALGQTMNYVVPTGGYLYYMFLYPRQTATLTFTSSTTWVAPKFTTSIAMLAGRGGTGSAASSSLTYEMCRTATTTAFVPPYPSVNTYVVDTFTTCNASTASEYVPPNASYYYYIGGDPAPGTPIEQSQPNYRYVAITYQKKTNRFSSPATYGGAASAFGYSFSGSYGGTAATTTYNNIVVVPGQSYTITVPSGGSISITYSY